MKLKFQPVFFTLVLAVLPTASASAVESAAPYVTYFEDAVLLQYVDEALEQRPELAQVEASVEASREKTESVAALPDPMLSFGIQNDGFSGIQIGKMEGSYVSIMAQQTLPWPGKRGLRGDIQNEVVQQGEADRTRVRLSIVAEVRRAYLDLVLVRDQFSLLSDLETLWREAEGMARARYETGEGVQADVLRAQLENSRLRQRRWALEAEEHRQMEILNRLRSKPLGSPVTATVSLIKIAAPTLPDEEQAFAFAERQSPELARARAVISQSQRETELARKGYYPDYTLSAALMPRGGPFPTMWQLGVGVSVPLWAAQKQSREIAAATAQSRSETLGAEATRQILRQRVIERLALLRSLLGSLELYRSGLLVQSSATAQSTMAHYRVGDVTFASVLEALAGYLNDVKGYYETVAAAERILIAMDEISLDSPAGADAALGGSAMSEASSGSQGKRRTSSGESSGM